MRDLDHVLRLGDVKEEWKQQRKFEKQALMSRRSKVFDLLQ